MDAVLLVIVGALLAHFSAIVTGWQHHRLDHREHRREQLRTFRIEQLLALQAALFNLEEAVRQASVAGGPKPGAVDLAATAQVRRSLVLIDDPELRDAVTTLLAALPLAGADAIDATNAAIGERVRMIAAE